MEDTYAMWRRVVKAAKRGRLQIMMSGALVVGFLAAALATWLSAESIDSNVNAIVGDALPSVRLLSQARTDLHHLGVSFEDYAASARGSRAAIRSARHALDASLDAYVALPFFPTERGLYNNVHESLVNLDATLQSALDRVDHDDHGAPKLVFPDVQRAIEIVDGDLSNVVAFDTAEGQRLGLSVLRARRSAGATALSLNALAIGLAVFATVLAVRALRLDMRTLEQARDSAAERAAETEERNAELEQFSGRVAHDILSPLMGAGMALEVSKARLASDLKARETIERGTRSLQRVRRIVDGLLEFARAAAKPSEGAAAQVAEIVADVTDGVRPEAQAAGIEIVASPIAPCSVACSPGALTSILANLVRNAIKYMGDSQERGIAVRVAPTAEAVRVEVEDTGPGIPPELEGKLFEPFVRGTSRSPGIGLGLATVKRLTLAHGGRVGCRSGPSAGSVFWFELPRIKAVAA